MRLKHLWHFLPPARFAVPAVEHLEDRLGSPKLHVIFRRALAANIYNGAGFPPGFNCFDLGRHSCSFLLFTCSACLSLRVAACATLRIAQVEIQITWA